MTAPRECAEGCGLLAEEGSRYCQGCGSARQTAYDDAWPTELGPGFDDAGYGS